MQGIIKVNEDDSFSVEFNRGGIDEIFGDHDDRILLLSKQISIDLAIHIELLAVHEVLLVAVTSRWGNSSNFVFKSNFQNIIVWLSDPLLAPLEILQYTIK